MDTAATTLKQHAIVLGGSLTGLLAAKVLSKHYAKVSIIEKDVVHREPEARKGQPQTRHLHGLLPGGLEVLSRYFPGLLDEMASHGSKVLDFAKSMNWSCYGAFRKSFAIGIKGVTISRPLLEHIVRERVLALSNVQMIDNTPAKHLVTTDDKQKITGVVTEERETGKLIPHTADLVVDATGRGSRTPQWLKDLGYGEVSASEVKVDVGYTTRVYERDPADPRGDTWIVSTPQAPAETRFGGAFAVEGNKWIITVGGWHGDHAPIQEAKYLEFVKSLPNANLYDIVSKSKPASEFSTYKFPLSLRRHYEKLNHFPKGFLVLGDAISSFNPIYGQGMSSAALQVEVLDRILEENVPEDKFASIFFKRSKKIIDNIWDMATGEDFRYPQTIGTRPAAINLINKYVAQIHKATTKDEVVCAAFLKVMGLLKPPALLFHPAILWRVLKAK
jgi:2-polyprenyl-6-methoxyphenol hydroxylase-like FAD-dependent oxidoreductase